MHRITRSLLRHQAEWLSDMVSNRRGCPNWQCDRGEITIEVERPTRDYPGWYEGRTCPKCDGKSYIPRGKYRRIK